MSDREEVTLDGAEPLSQQEPDWFLQSFVIAANKYGYGIPITLLVGGSWITGDLIGGREYFELLGKQITGEPGAAETDSPYQTYIDRLYPEVDPDAEDDAGDPTLDSPTFIHLKNARQIHRGGEVPNNHADILWRGRLVSVEGFMLGDMQLDGPTG